MKKYLSFFVLAVALVFGSCGGSEPEDSAGESPNTETPKASTAADIDYDAWAGELCVCMTPMIDFQSKMMEVLAKEGEGGLASLEEEAKKIQVDGEACMNDLEKKYGVVEGPESETKAMGALEKACPDFIAMMEATAPPPGYEGAPAE